MTGHDHLPSRQPERSPEEQAQSVWCEVLNSDGALRGSPFLNPVETEESWLQGNEKEAQLSQAFRRGRAILQVIAYGRTYWEVETGLGFITPDKEVVTSQHPAVLEGYKRLIQLVILSRANLVDQDGWRLTDTQDLAQIEEEITGELGLTREYEELVEAQGAWDTPTFPGCDDKTFVDAILSGKVRVGNPDDPEALDLTP